MTNGTPMTRTPRFTPPRDRKVDCLSVRCPDCGAAERKNCTKLDGSGAQTGRHPARRRMAVRRLNGAPA